MNYRPTRSLARRLAPLTLLMVGLLAFFAHSALASATPAIGNQKAECQGYGGFASYQFWVNGDKVNVTAQNAGLHGKTTENDRVKLTFKLKESCDNLYVGLNTYKMGQPTFTLDQDLFDRDADTFKADGEFHSVAVTIPPCYFQVDAYTGSKFKVGDFSRSGGPGFITADIGGNDKNCSQPTTTTTKKPTTTTEKPTTTTTQAAVVPNKAKIAPVCLPGSTGWSITFTNNASTKQNFYVYLANGKEIDKVSVNANKSLTKSYSFADHNIAAGETAKVRVVNDDDELDKVAVTNDCLDVNVTVVAECDTEVGTGAVFTFNNDGKIDETFTVTDVNGTEFDWSPVTVVAGETVTKTQVVADNAQTDFVIKGQNSAYDETKSVQTSCVEPVPVAPPTTLPTEVLGETITQPQLAYTGFDLLPQIIVATGLVALGAALMYSGRRHREYLN